MARGQVELECKECGATFVKTITCYSRKEADEWESRAPGLYPLCPSCWGKDQRKKETQQPLQLNVALLPFERKILLYFSGNTKPQKEEIKVLRYHWDPLPPIGLLGWLSNSSHSHYTWLKRIDVDELDGELKKASETGALIKNDISPIDIASMHDLMAHEKEKEEKIEAEISKLDKPVSPDDYPTGRWNGRFYGGAKYGYSVYVDGEQQKISIEQANKWQQYMDDRNKYQEKVKIIKNKY